jgi:transposase
MNTEENIVAIIREKYQALKSILNERQRRLWAAMEAKVLGHGGQTLVQKATGLSRRTLYEGLQELKPFPDGQDTRVKGSRHQGGGRQRLAVKDTQLLSDLDTLVEPTSRGDPATPRRWTCKSLTPWADELKKQGHPISRQKVSELLQALGYSLQGARKGKEGGSNPDRDAQFNYINERVKAFQQRGQPVISIDTKKKELVGEFQNKGREWRPQGCPEKVQVYDFIDKDLGKVNPYGVYDLSANEGWVNVGTDHNTAEFAVESIRRWGRTMGHARYPQATELLITADGGGSNGSRNRLWKVRLQTLADELGLRISVCHFPPGTSKWNKIEHRMFSYIRMNWRGRPLVNLETVVNLIANTTTEKGLKIQADLDDTVYPTGLKVSDQELEAINLKKADFHGEWNYSISPKSGE